MNKVILVGRLARDPELRTTSTGKSVCSFAIAVDRRFKQDGQPTADFFNVTAWGRQAEIINQYLGKGREIAITGRLQNNSFVGRDGTKRYSTDVILDEFDFIGGRGNSGGGGGGYAGGSQGGGNSNNMPLDDVMDDEFHLMADDEDVPF